MLSVHDYLKSIGYSVDKLPLNMMVGKEYRFPSLGKGHKNQSASIRLTHEGIYVWHDHSCGSGGSFNPNRDIQGLAPLEIARRATEQKLAAERYAKATKQRQSKAKNEAQSIWNRAKSCLSHPYMHLAGVSIAGEVRTLPHIKTNNGQTFKKPLIIPRYDTNTGELVNLEFITEDGTKRPLAGAKKNSTYFEISGNCPALFVEGYKTGCAVHNATGRKVIVCFDVGNLKLVWKDLAKSDDEIISDNDNGLKSLETNAIITALQIKAKGAGHKAAYDLGAKFWLIPEVGADAADIQPKKILQLISQKPTSELPIFDAWNDLETIKDMTSSELLKQLESESNYLKCASLALSYGIKQLQCIPFKTNILKIRAEVETVTAGRIHPITLDNIALKLDWMYSKTTKIGLQAISIDDTKQHNTISIDNLNNFTPNYKGIWLIKAPTGAGKTQKVGKPFRNWCKSNGYTFLSIAHLQSLVREMSSRLNTEHYDDEKKAVRKASKSGNDGLWQRSLDSLSICLPSLAYGHFQPFVASCKYVFIDEISQVLNAFSSDEIYRHTDVTIVFDLLRQIIRNAECLICADANINQMTLDFIEQCRPNERFNIVEMPAVNEGKNIKLYSTDGELLNKIVESLFVDNANIWITCDSQKQAEKLQRYLSQYDEISVLAITGANKGKKDQKAFLENPHKESKKYRVVISSPVISSGLSIEHDHFNFVAGFFCGTSVQPTDAYQQLGRVRCAKDFHITLDQKHQDVMNADQQINGQSKAAMVEGEQIKPSDFAMFRAKLNESRDRYKSNFANNLLHILNDKKFSIEHVPFTDASDQDLYLKEIGKELKAEEQLRIKSATKITDEQALLLKRKDCLNDNELYSLKAYGIRKALGYEFTHNLTDQDLEASPAQIRRFSAFIGRFKASNDKSKDIAVRKFDEALAKIYQIVFENVNLQAGSIFYDDCAKAILERVYQYRHVLAVLGGIPKRFGNEFFKPSDSPVKELNAILKHIGISTLRTRFSAKMGHIGIFLYRKNSSSVPNWQAEKCYKVDGDQLEIMQHYSDLKAHSYQTLPPLSEDAFWQGVRLALYHGVQTHTITEAEAIQTLIDTSKARPISKPSHITAWWAKNVLRPLFSAVKAVA